MQRVADVHADPAVQVVAGPQRRRGLVGQPVRRHVEVARRPRGRCPAASRPTGGQVQRARGDVDVGDLLGHGLERRERPAELLPRPHVRGGQRERGRERAVGQAARPGHRELVQIGEPARPSSPVTGRARARPAPRSSRSVYSGAPGRAVRAPPGHARPDDLATITTAVPPAGDAGRDQDPVGRRAVGHADLDSGDRARLAAPPAWPWWRAARASRPRGSRTAAVSTVSPDATPASSARCRSRSPHRTTGSTPRASVASAGTGGGPPADLGQRQRHVQHPEPVPAQPGRAAPATAGRPGRVPSTAPRRTRPPAAARRPAGPGPAPRRRRGRPPAGSRRG